MTSKIYERANVDDAKYKEIVDEILAANKLVIGSVCRTVATRLRLTICGFSIKRTTVSQFHDQAVLWADCQYMGEDGHFYSQAIPVCSLSEQVPENSN